MPALPKHELRQLVAVACTDDALRQLLELLAGLPKHRREYNAMTLLSGEWQELEESQLLNLRSAREMAPDRARISAAVLHYLDKLPDEIAAPKGKNPAPEAALRQSVQAIAADMAWHYDLFFSFSSQDLEPARAFCHALRGHGLRVFFSADDLRQRGGHNFGDIIDRALRQSRHFLLFCSPNAMQSKWVKLEHDTFFQNYHLPDERVRGFFIAEGPDFQDGLVPTFYRRIQRTPSPETLLHALTGFAPAETRPQPQAPENQAHSPSAPTAPLPHSTAPLPPLTAAEEHAWDFTADTDTRAAYGKFLNRFPQGHYAPEAQSRLDALDADDTAWEFASDNGTEKALQKYLSKYPSGLHAQEASEQLAVFERERKAAEDLKAKEAEDKRLADLADLAAEAQRAKEAEAQRAKEAEAQQAKEAEHRRAAAEAAAKKQREAEETADHHAFYLARTRADFEDYLKKGHALHADEAREKVAVFKKQEDAAAEARRAQEAEAARKKAEAEEKRQREAVFSKKHNTAIAHERAGRYADAQTAFNEALQLHEAGFEVTKNQVQQQRDGARKSLLAAEAQRVKDAEAEEKHQREAVFSKKYHTAITHEWARHYAGAKTAFDEALLLHEAGFAVTKIQLQQDRDRVEKALAVEIERQRKEVEHAREAEDAARKKPEQEEADHQAFYLARTRTDLEDYLKKGYSLHADEARKEIAVFKKQEKDAEVPWAQEAATRREQEAAKRRAEQMAADMEWEQEYERERQKAEEAAKMKAEVEKRIREAEEAARKKR